MRINTEGRYEYRAGLYDDASDLLGERTRSKAIDCACLSTRQMLLTLERAVNHPDMTEGLAVLLVHTICRSELFTGSYGGLEDPAGMWVEPIYPSAG